LVDAFAIPDYVLNSPLGRFDGNIYESYFATVKSRNPQGEHPYFKKVISPLINRNIEHKTEPEDGEDEEVD
jgi:acyl-CoA oxidase